MLHKQKLEEGERKWDLKLWDSTEIPRQKVLGFLFI